MKTLVRFILKTSVSVKESIWQNIKIMFIPFKKFAYIDGRSTRKEFFLYQLLATFLLLFFVGLITIYPGFFVEEALFLLVIIPNISLTIRRLHDTNLSGWFVLIAVIPFGWFFLLLLCLKESYKYTNKWGEKPENVIVK